MQRVKVNLRHCYGIKSLEQEFDFSDTNVYAIYAPNGVMKSSFAETLRGLATGHPPEDRMFPHRECSRSIVDETDSEISGESVLVVLPYDEEFGPTEKTSTLLVDAKLRTEYEELNAGIEKAKASLLKAVREQAGSRRDFERELCAAFTSGNDFERAVKRIRDELGKQTDAPFADVKYDVIFDDKVMNALNAQDLQDAIEGYITRYNELLEASTYFKRGTFDYYNAGQIAKSLADNGFFKANHTIQLNATGETLEIATQKELESVIANEKEAILKDKDLRSLFDEVEKKLARNAQLRQFCRYLQENESLLPQLGNVPQFREEILKSYLKVHYELYQSLMEKFDSAEERMIEIRDEARRQQTQWQQVISIFNERFFVPFQLQAKNYIEVMLGNEQMIELGFTYVDGDETAEVDKPKLMRVLSTGERKALYVLNVIFEIERRIKEGQQTLVVVDDIADSFDYQNKYAIIQYLKDISEEGIFKLIIMTHNFDFFRTLQSRFVRYQHCLMASRTESGVSLVQATGIRNVFANDWRKNFYSDVRKKIGSVSFLRNLVEMSTGEDDSAYATLTSMLHWRGDSANITIRQLDNIFKEICGLEGSSSDPEMPVWELIAAEAAACATEQTHPRLENKIVLAIGIRLMAEQYMVGKIQDESFLNSISANQTQALIKRFKEQFPADQERIRVLERVALMTPENIHVNSFMYEPILDMSDEHLKALHEEVINLQGHHELSK